MAYSKHPDEIVKLMQANGLNVRDAQHSMMNVIHGCLNPVSPDGNNRSTGEHMALVEAGTGTGKSYGYLLPTIGFGKDTGKKIVVATAVVALQEQLLNLDIPACEKILGYPITAALAKGKGRYLCQLRLENERNENKGQPIHFYDKVERKVASGWSGDFDKLDMTEGERKLLSRIQVPHLGCLKDKCLHYQRCGYFKARKLIKDADVVIANHSLVLADLELDGALLGNPKDIIYVLDEAHSFPSKAVDFFSMKIDYYQVEETFKKMNELLDTIALHNTTISVPLGGELKKIKKLFTKLKNKLMLNSAGEYTPFSLKVNNPWEQEIIEECAALLPELLNFNEQVSLAWEVCRSVRLNKVDEEHGGALITVIQDRFGEWASCFQEFITPPTEKGIPFARWIEARKAEPKQQHETLMLCVSPCMATDILPKFMYNRAYAIIFTSATLRSLGDMRLYLFKSGLCKYKDLHQVCLPGVFDYKRGALYLPPMDENGKKTPDPNDYGYPVWLAEQAVKLHREHRGLGWLMLFTSKKQMAETALALRNRNYPVMVQYERPNAVLLDDHKKRVKDGLFSFLFGLASFAEGLDLPGNLCERVIITRLPFKMSEHPVDKTLDQWLSAQKRSSFVEISLPEASATLIQQTGRLLRKETDEGKIFLMDRRILDKWDSYGKRLIKSLPPFLDGRKWQPPEVKRDFDDE